MKLQRYRTAAERGYHRALNEIRRQQTDPLLMEAYRDLPVELPPMADPRELAKRKHSKSGHSLGTQWVREEEQRFKAETEEFNRQWAQEKAKAAA